MQTLHETILATRQDFFKKIISYRAEYRWHCITGFLNNTALVNVYFSLYYHLFFRKEIYFCECLYVREYDIRM